MGALSPNQLASISDPIVKRYTDLNNEALQSIGETIGEVGEILPTDVYAIQSIYETSQLRASEIEQELARISGRTEEDIRKMFEAVAREQYNFYKPFYSGDMIPFAENIALQRTLTAMIDLTQQTCKNIANHTAFMVFDRAGVKVPTSISETYSRVTDYAIQAITNGGGSYESTMRKVLNRLADSGIRDTVTYANGYTRRIDTAVRQNLQWGVKQVFQNISEQVAKETGADGWEISYHSNPRPTHEEMGGRQYSLRGPVTINGVFYPPFSDVEHLLDDYNCLHTKDAIFLGISEPNYSPEQLARMKAEDREPIEFDGQTMTKYEASQVQRKLETAMRHCQDRQNIAKSAGANETLLREQNRMRQLKLKYNQLSRASGLPTKYERTVSNWGGAKRSFQDYGLNDKKPKSSKKTLTNDSKSDTIREKTGIKALDKSPILRSRSIADCVMSTNPNYENSIAYRANCQRCVSAYEARRRGYDVTASAKFSKKEQFSQMYSPKGWTNVFENGLDSLVSFNGVTVTDVHGEIIEQMKSYGDGARAIIRVKWVNGNGHVFIAEQFRGKTYFVDPQNGDMNVSRYFENGGIVPFETKLLRIDDKKFTHLINKCIEVKK